VLLRQEKTLKLCMNHKGQPAEAASKQRASANTTSLALLVWLLALPLVLYLASSDVRLFLSCRVLV
jgi:hypothetical protein